MVCQPNTKTKSVLVIGGNGFIGKVVLEQLLTRQDVAQIFLLLRPKRGSSEMQRMQQLCKNPAFQNIKPHDFDKIKVISGDITKPDLGMCPEDRELVAKSVTHIINLAATVAFDLPLQEAAETNVTGALKVLDLAEDCNNLVSLNHCSTAYVNAPRTNDRIKEEVLSIFSSAEARHIYQEKIIGAQKIRQAEETELLSQFKYPNTYTFTKGLAETLLVEESLKRGVPLAIVRPSIVSACFQHPMPGWIDSRAALAAFVSLIGSGFLHTVAGKEDTKLDVVPCDYVANRIVQTSFSSTGHKDKVTIVHATAGPHQSLTVKQISDLICHYFQNSKQNMMASRVYVRTMAEQNDPSVGKSFQKDKRRVKALVVIAKLLHRKKLAKTLDRILFALEKIEEVFPFFTHNSFHFESKTRLTDVFPNFDGESYLNLVNEGTEKFLLAKQPSNQTKSNTTEKPLKAEEKRNQPASLPQDVPLHTRG